MYFFREYGNKNALKSRKISVFNVYLFPYQKGLLFISVVLKTTRSPTPHLYEFLFLVYRYLVVFLS
jgi:hypothetical protein